MWGLKFSRKFSKIFYVAWRKRVMKFIVGMKKHSLYPKVHLSREGKETQYS